MADKLDIIVSSHNNLGRTIRCLEAIYKHTPPPFNLCLVDDSTDLTSEYIKSLRNGNITHVRSDGYKNTAEVMEAGLANTSSEFLAYMGNSCEVEPNWLSPLLWIMENNPDVAIVAPKLLTPAGVIETAGLYLNKELKPMQIGTGEQSHRFTHVMDCSILSLAVALIRRDALVGSMDKDTYIGFRGLEDIDLCLTLKQKGWNLSYCGLSAVYHQHYATRPYSAETNDEYERNFTRFVNKWTGHIDKELIWQGQYHQPS